jgi:hypothetical protein
VESGTLAIGLDDLAAVREPVERRAGEPLGTQNLGLVFTGFGGAGILDSSCR